MLSENPIVLENKRAGSDKWQLTYPATEREIEGYASATSINKGDTIHFFVNTKARYFDCCIYRMGWYQGLGARLIRSPITLAGTEQLIPVMDTSTGLVDCDWQISLSVMAGNPEDTSDWPSGVYLAKLIESEQGKQSYIVFVVRDDTRQAAILVQQSVTTYQAYNNWGGKSFYKWNSTDNQRASKVSFNRPYAGNEQNPAAAYGIGAGEFICNVQPNNPDYPISNAGWEYNMVRWLEREGYDVSYCTNIDIHDNANLTLNYRAFLSVGHDEYWSLSMRDNLEYALSCNRHLGFFGANTGYWQVRFEDSQVNAQKNRIMVCHKSAKRDNYAQQLQWHHQVTCQWRDAPVSRPEAQLLGVMYVADPVDADIVITQADHLLFKKTGLMNGAKLPGLLGYEVDAVDHSSPVAVEILAHSPWTKLNDSKNSGYANMTYYVTDTGASVFAAGTIQWSWALDDFNVPQLRTSRNNQAAQQITRNLLESFISYPVLS